MNFPTLLFEVWIRAVSLEEKFIRVKGINPFLHQGIYLGETLIGKKSSYMILFLLVKIEIQMPNNVRFAEKVILYPYCANIKNYIEDVYLLAWKEVHYLLLVKIKIGYKNMYLAYKISFWSSKNCRKRLAKKIPNISSSKGISGLFQRGLQFASFCLHIFFQFFYNECILV